MTVNIRSPVGVLSRDDLSCSLLSLSLFPDGNLAVEAGIKSERLWSVQVNPAEIRVRRVEQVVPLFRNGD